MYDYNLLFESTRLYKIILSSRRYKLTGSDGFCITGGQDSYANIQRQSDESLWAAVSKWSREFRVSTVRG